MRKDYLKGFAEFSNSDRVDEMASSLTKLGVAKDLMQFIHKLKGVATRPKEATKQYNPRTGREDIAFHTYLEPGASRKGPHPATEDVPMSHDVEVNGTKTGLSKIRHYLEQVVPKNKDTDPRLILVNPREDLAYYITRKTGKTTPAEREAKYGESDIAKSRDLSRWDETDPVSEKLGMYIRTVAIDLDSGMPISRWEGTIGQMVSNEIINDDSILYIMEKEDRVREKRKKRKKLKEVKVEDFLEYFKTSLGKVASRLINRESEAARKEIKDIRGGINYSELPIDSYGRMQIPQEQADRIAELERKITSEEISDELLKIKLHSFLELAHNEGEYEKAKSGMKYSWSNEADLSDMVDIHTMPVVASMFLQFIVAKKVTRKFHTANVLKALGIDDLF